MNEIVNPNNAIRYNWGEHATAYQLCETDNLSVKFEILPSRETEQLHFHNQSIQVFYILKGTAKFIIDKNEFELKVNDSITIYPNQKHLVKNEENEDLELLVISNPSTKNDRKNVAYI